MRLRASIAETMNEHFGAFLLVELWTEDDRPADARSARPHPPRLPHRRAGRRRPRPHDRRARDALGAIRVQGWNADVTIAVDAAPAPPHASSLAEQLVGPVCHVFGLAVRPVYRDAHTGAVFPVVLQSLRRQLAVALRKSVFAFTGHAQEKPHTQFESLGPSALAKAARLVDQQLSEVSEAFDFVLQTVPLNSATAWDEFAASDYARAPQFYYRPLPYDPAALKRRLFEIPIDRIEDATLIHLFEQKQDHLDRQLTALKNIDAPPFFYDSMQLYGTPDQSLVAA